MNSKRGRQLMKAMGISGKVVCHKRRTTNSDHTYPRCPNLVQELVIDHPNQVWVVDITYIILGQKLVYLAVILDVFTRSIQGWHLGRNIDQELMLTTLRRALEQETPAIYHSDQGVQYAGTDYVKVLCARCSHQNGRG